MDGVAPEPDGRLQLHGGEEKATVSRLGAAAALCPVREKVFNRRPAGRAERPRPPRLLATKKVFTPAYIIYLGVVALIVTALGSWTYERMRPLTIMDTVSSSSSRPY